MPAQSLTVLLFLGTQPEGSARYADVRKACGTGQSRTSRLVAALARAGFVHASSPPNDLRQTHIALTAKGLRVIDQFVQAARSRR